MVTDTLYINTTTPEGASIASNLFGYIDPLGNDYNYFPESSLAETYTLFVYGREYIGSEYDGTPIYRRYSIDSMDSVNASDLAPNLNVDITSVLDEEDHQGFKITFTGSLKYASDGTTSMTYRNGLATPVTTNNLASFPTTASLTSISGVRGDELITLEFDITSETKDYTVTTPLYVRHETVIFPPQTSPKAASRKGDKEIDHGYSVKSSSEGSSDVFIDGIAAHTTGQSWPSHNRGDSWHTGRSTSTGSGSVYINGEALARVSNSISCGSKIAQGSTTVFSG